MSKERMALATLKTIETSARSRYAMRWADCKRLAKTLVLMGYGFLLHDLSPVAAQTLALTGKGISTPEYAKKQEKTRSVVAGTCFTGEVYPMRDGQLYDVYQSRTGKRFIVKPNGKRYYPARLNK